ncbi:hypothetical protein MTP99_016352 [Tenebrio molitor]|nr:hypothetical protein MTP99_016352 [Tenebrio molitor]
MPRPRRSCRSESYRSGVIYLRREPPPPTPHPTPPKTYGPAAPQAEEAAHADDAAPDPIENSTKIYKKLLSLFHRRSSIDGAKKLHKSQKKHHQVSLLPATGNILNREFRKDLQESKSL